MTKIVITGGLGYIGTELCKIYSGEARYKEIIVIDNRFISERVKQITDWGMKFIQCSILDEDMIKFILQDADIVYHLAGVTDVAYTKTESNIEKDNLIKTFGIDGTRNIIKFTPSKGKIIFPSTHVVYEGFTETKFEIEETEPTKPILSYSKTKAQSEQDLFESQNKFVIVRFGSVYGYSTDTMRINIMPNLFSKIASQNGTINLFSGGVQHKSLIALLDACRALKFLAESDYNRDIFHLSNENMTVKQIAEICKKINPLVKLVETDDEIPNLGYTISNKKLLSTGFKFLYSIEESIKEMIKNWSEKRFPEELEFIIKGSKEFIDDRGKISNYELTEPINLIGYIESKKGTVRANHFHPIQEQKCLLIKGKYVSVTKDLAVDNAVIETRVIQSGDIAVIRPNVAHTMVFLEDSIFLNLVRGEREHENYGITHTIPYILVDESLRKIIMETYKLECRSCGNSSLEDVLSLGLSPLANNLKESKEEKEESFPLEMKFCEKCKNCQLSVVVPPKKMFDNYLYVSSTAETFRNHFEKAAIKYIDRFNLNESTLVVDIGSNDGVFLKPLIQRGIKAIGVEPARNLADLANEEGLQTYNSYFNASTTKSILKDFGRAKIVTASNVFAHSDELINITKEAFNLLEENGVFIIEVQYLLDTFRDLTFDNIYHEHVNYWSLTSLNNFFKNISSEFKIIDVEHILTHGGSLRVYVSKSGEINQNVEKFLKEEELYEISNIKTYRDFAKRVLRIKENVIKNMSILRKKYSRIAGYGSPAKATTSLNYFGINDSFIGFTIEDNEMKNNKFIPGVNIPIKNKKYLENYLPEIIIVLAWNFHEYIVEKNKELLDKGVKFISIKDLQKDNLEINNI